jgi:peptidoglycan/LPS O-acetylase OafA/YrhL
VAKLDVHRRPALDGLRGCAVLLVIAGHTTQPQHQSLSVVGVTLFFVLSGYLITTILLRERSSTGRTGYLAFYGRRARRLLPALAVLLLFDGAIRVTTGQSLVPVLLAATYGTNIATALGHSSTLTHTWSLALEEQFYLLWPLVLPLVWRRRRGVALVVAAAAVSATARLVVYLTGPWTLAYFSPVTRVDAILVGCALAMATARGWRLPGGRWPVWVALAAFGAAFARRDLGWAVFAIPFASMASAVLVARLAQPESTLLHRALSGAAIRHLGRISYGMYLWHPFVLAAVVGAGLPQRFLVTVALVTAVASASWYLVERPVLRSAGAAAQVGHVGGDGRVEAEAECEVGRREVGGRDLAGEAGQGVPGLGSDLADPDAGLASGRGHGLGEDPRLVGLAGQRVGQHVAQHQQGQSRRRGAVEERVGEDVVATVEPTG